MKVFVILHNIRSLHNVGSIFRTAEGLGVKKLYLTGYTPGPYDIFGKLRKDFAKTALGAEKSADWTLIKNIHTLIKRLKKDRVQIVALEQSRGAIPLDRFAEHQLGGPTAKLDIALILGNEVRGVPKSVLKKCDVVVEISMCGKKESLNVSVAAGVVIYELVRQFRN